MEGRMSCEPDKDGDGANKEDIILSLSEATYRLQRLGPKTKRTVAPDRSKLAEAEAAEEVFNMFKNKGGRFCKLDKNWRDTEKRKVIELGEEDALKKIRLDMLQRMESANRWLGTETERPEESRSRKQPTEILGTKSAAKNKRSARNNGTTHTDQRSQPAETQSLDYSMLKVGSRVLITCGVDEPWLKATVKSNGIRDGRRSFLVHFDGHRATNQSWIGEEKIAGFLFHRTHCANTEESILPAEAETGGVAESQDTTYQFDPLGAADIHERLRIQEARIDALVGSHGDINNKVESLDKRVASQNDLTSQILTDNDSAIVKLQKKTDHAASQFQGDIIKLQSNQRIQDTRNDRVQSELGDLSRKLEASNEKIEASAADLFLQLDGVVSQVAKYRRETRAVHTKVDDHFLNYSDRPHQETLEESTIQALVTEVVDNSIKSNETIAKLNQNSNLFITKVHEMSTCSLDHSKGLSNHGSSIRVLRSEQRAAKTTNAEFAEELNRLDFETAAKLSRIELQLTKNEAQGTKFVSEIEHIKALIGQSTDIQSHRLVHAPRVTFTKRKSPQSTSSTEAQKRLKLISVDPRNMRPQLNPPIEVGIHPHECRIQEATENDVICGRGGAIYKHPGNRRFRKFIDDFKRQYLQETFKPKVTMHVLKLVKQSNPPGRFLEKSPDGGGYLECSEEKVKMKVRQALQEGAAKLRKEDDDDEMLKVVASTWTTGLPQLTNQPSSCKAAIRRCLQSGICSSQIAQYVLYRNLSSLEDQPTEEIVQDCIRLVQNSMTNECVPYTRDSETV